MNDYMRNSARFCMQDYFIMQSLETHLFFSRIMREHALFLQAGFQPVNDTYIRRADGLRSQFEELLWQAVRLSEGTVSEEVLKSGEIVTGFTESAEKSTGKLTGIPIDIRITQAEQRLQAGHSVCGRREMWQRVRQLNARALELVNSLISFKEELIREVSECRLFTANYLLLIKHILREAKLYRSMIIQLSDRGFIPPENLCGMESFWNQIMMEHALFIRGLLDPAEEELIQAANGFAGDYRALLTEAGRRDCEAMDELTRKTIAETIKYRDFKAEGAKGILECRIEAIILPLLADHVLREANHYLRLLKNIGKNDDINNRSKVATVETLRAGMNNTGR